MGQTAIEGGLLFWLIRTIAEVIGFLLMLRFALQFQKVDPYNPISQSILMITDPFLRPLRRLLPRVHRRVDSASLLAAWLLHCATLYLQASMILPQAPAPTLILTYGLLQLADSLIDLFILVIFLWVLLSWLSPDPRHPAGLLLYQLCEPLLKKIRKVIPPVGMLDWSPLVALLLLNLLSAILKSLAFRIPL